MCVTCSVTAQFLLVFQNVAEFGIKDNLVPQFENLLVHVFVDCSV